MTSDYAPSGTSAGLLTGLALFDVQRVGVARALSQACCRTAG